MNKYVIKNANILDGSKDMEVTSGKLIYVDGEIISDIVDDNEKIKEGYQVIDLNNKYIMPGLINLHVHLAVSGGIPKKRSKPVNYKKLFDLLTKYKLIKQYFLSTERGYVKNQLLSGVTTLRAVGGILNYDGIIRDEVNCGKTLGPRILTSNAAITVPNGHFAGSLAVEATSPIDAANYVDKFLVDNPDLVKVMITGGVMDSDKEGEPGALRMPGEYVKAVCDRAHKYNLPVAAHVESKAGVEVALLNDVDTIEHGSFLDDNLVKLFKEKKASLVTTISPALPYALFELSESRALPAAKENGKIVLNGIIQSCKEALKNDIPVGLGTDSGCPFTTQYDFYREGYYFTKYANVSNKFSLYTMTLGNAKILKLDDKIGSIEKCKIADMIVCDKNPLDDILALRTLSNVIYRGNIINNPKPKKNKKIEALLDKYM